MYDVQLCSKSRSSHKRHINNIIVNADVFAIPHKPLPRCTARFSTIKLITNAAVLAIRR